MTPIFSQRHRIKFISMSHCNKKNSSLVTPKKTKYNDWTCSLCQNYNYSFRVICNRCHIQHRDIQNAVVPVAYTPTIEPYLPQNRKGSDDFPYLVLLGICEEETPTSEPDDWRDGVQDRWISQLID